MPEIPETSTELRKALTDAIAALDSEGFNAIAWQVYQMAKTSGGYMDHEGWAKVRANAEAIPFIADLQAKSDAAYAKADDTPIVVMEEGRDDA